MTKKASGTCLTWLMGARSCQLIVGVAESEDMIFLLTDGPPMLTTCYVTL